MPKTAFWTATATANWNQVLPDPDSDTELIPFFHKIITSEGYLAICTHGKTTRKCGIKK